MNPLALLLFLACAIALLAVPRKWAPVPLLIGCTYMTMGQGINIGINLPVYRMLLLVGVLRVIVKQESLPGGLNLIDKLMIAWGVWTVFCSFFHDPTREGPIYASGMVFNQALPYFLIRSWCADIDEVGDVIRIIAILLIPLAAEMLVEKLTGKNSFAVFGKVSPYVLVRDGKLRAQGPFGTPILAGTLGATCIPLFIGILKRHRIEAMLGIGAGLFIVFSSASSGPVMSLMAGAGALMLWKWKAGVGIMRKGMVIMYILLSFVMAKPPYYLISRIDLSGGSTGWHRSFLIDQTIVYFKEWWLVGTDTTRHWMPMQGIGIDPNHTDITNYYIAFGASAGLLGMLLVIWMLVAAFRWVGRVHDARIEGNRDDGFMIWCLGACLFSHVVTGISVSYFDQTMLYYWLSVAVISSAYSTLSLRQDVPANSTWEDEDVEIVPDALAVAQANAEWRRKLWERAGTLPLGRPNDPS
jgi:hypothetical protein